MGKILKDDAKIKMKGIKVNLTHGKALELYDKISYHLDKALDSAITPGKFKLKKDKKLAEMNIKNIREAQRLSDLLGKRIDMD